MQDKNGENKSYYKGGKVKFQYISNTNQRNMLDFQTYFSKKKGYLNYEQREYPPEFFESFYDNLRKWGKYETI